MLIGIYSCGKNTAKKKINPKVDALASKIIPLVRFIDNPDSCRKALSFLDSATMIDNKCFLCYQNKLMFLFSLKRYDKAIQTNDTLISLAPNAHDLYLTGGILCEANKDTVSSMKYFRKCLSICNSVLDTMNRSNRDYTMLASNKAICMIMLGDQMKANDVLKKLYDTEPNDSVFGNVTKDGIQLLMNKTRGDLIKSLLNPSDNN